MQQIRRTREESLHAYVPRNAHEAECTQHALDLVHGAALGAGACPKGARHTISSDAAGIDDVVVSNHTVAAGHLLAGWRPCPLLEQFEQLPCPLDVLCRPGLALVGFGQRFACQVAQLVVQLAEIARPQHPPKWLIARDQRAQRGACEFMHVWMSIWLVLVLAQLGVLHKGIRSPRVCCFFDQLG